MGRNIQFDRDEALDKAIQYFWRRGYFVSSVDDISREIGISKSSLYNSFGGKEGIFKEAFERYKSTAPRRTLENISQRTSIKFALQRFFSLLVEIGSNDNDAKGCLVVNSLVEFSGADEALAELVMADIESLVDLYEKLISEAQEKHEVNERFTAIQIARHLANAHIGIRIMSRVFPKKTVLKDMADLALSILDD